ncbi:MAG: hypothetical protein V7K40_02635 [Nostoc sp.]
MRECGLVPTALPSLTGRLAANRHPTAGASLSKMGEGEPLRSSPRGDAKGDSERKSVSKSCGSESDAPTSL